MLKARDGVAKPSVVSWLHSSPDLCGQTLWEDVIHAPFLFRAVGLDFLLSKLLRADATRFRPDLHKRRRADFAEALPDLSSAGRRGYVLHAYVRSHQAGRHNHEARRAT